jgi:hypothetical protein
MPPIFKAIISLSVWLLFIKGVLLVPITVYTFSHAFLNGESTPMVGVVACAAGTLAFVSACVAAWIRKIVD